MRSDRYRIDSHKLMFHPERVAAWLTAGSHWEEAKRVYPIFMEVSPAGGCNHRCKFCALDYIGYQNRTIDPDVWERTAPELAEKGVKSIMFAGEGEPFLNRDMAGILSTTVREGIDASFTTNGVLMTPRVLDAVLPGTSWIKVSMNAGTPDTYATLHGTKPGDFFRVVENLKYAARVRKEANLRCTIGAQILLLPENASEVETLALLCRDEIGLDYLVIKPHSQHLFSNNKDYAFVDYEAITEGLDEIMGLSTSDFRVIYRNNTFRKYIEGEAAFGHCLSIPFFWAYIMADMDIYGCSAHLLNRDFYLGNLKEQSFAEIWEGEKRRTLWEKMRALDIRECRINCRMTFINEYLWELTHPHPHVNFI